MAEPTGSEKKIFGVNRNVFALGLTSMLNDLSSEVALKTIPFLLSNLLLAPLWFIGLVEGTAESTATLAKMVSGWLSDKLGHRKPLTMMGYGMAAITRPLLFLVHVLGSLAWGFIFLLRVMDRVGKGVRGAPRDALLAESCSKEERGHAFGFRHMMDEAGAFTGYGVAALVCLLTIGVGVTLEWSAYWWLVAASVVPAAGAVTVLWLMVKEARTAPKTVQEKAEAKRKADATPLGRTFWLFLGIMILFTLGNSTDAFLLLDAQKLQVPLFVIFLVYGCTSAVSGIVAIPAGKLSDRIGRKSLMIAGWALYAGVYLVYSLNPGPWVAGAALVIYGAYYGLTDGVARAIVADMVAKERRGTAYGLFNAAIGVGALPASLIGGALWGMYVGRFHMPFFVGAVMAGLAAVMLVFLPLHKGPAQQH